MLLFFASNVLGKLFFTFGLNHIERIALKLGEGSAGLRCGVVVGCREVSFLGSTFDRMLDIIQENTTRLQKLSNQDALTGLMNRRHFNELASIEVSAAQRYRYPLCIALADIDHFKKFNDP